MDRHLLVPCGTELVPWKPSLWHEHCGHCTWYCPLLIAVNVTTSIVCHYFCVLFAEELLSLLDERIKEWIQKLGLFPVSLLIIMYHPFGLSHRHLTLFSFFPVFLFNCLSLCCQFPAHSTGLKSTFILQLLTQTGYCPASFYSAPTPSAHPSLHSFSSSAELTHFFSFLFMWSTRDCFAESWYCVLMFLSTFNKHSHFINGHLSPRACFQGPVQNCK